MSFIDLFCGMGSFHYGLKSVGMECVYACDIYKPAIKNYGNNFGIIPDGRDLTQVDPNDIPPYDVLCAGFPCQPFSTIGKRTGFDHEKGNLFHTVVDIIQVTKPKAFVLENVQGLLSHNQRKTFSYMLRVLQECEYNVEWDVLKASDYGLPQNRKRVFIVGIRRDIKPVSVFTDLPKTQVNLSSFLQQDLVAQASKTIRIGGWSTKPEMQKNWNWYKKRDGSWYQLTIDDMLKLQGFQGYDLTGCKTAKIKLLGNTIPTCFTKMLGQKLCRIIGTTV